MWYNERVFYQIYPLNFVGAPIENDGVIVHRLNKINDYIPYLKQIGIGAIYFNPVFSSDTHGYDTRDYRKIDERLGTNDDMLELIKICHENDIKVVLDGVFNHVGRGFIPFLDVKEKRENSEYKDFFKIDFNGNSNYDDGFYYQGWEGHYELVELNLENPSLQKYLLDSVTMWIKEWDIDGIRLDVAYSLPRWFMSMLKDHCRSLKDDFFLLGEVLGDNAGYMFSEAHLDSITDYPGFKGIWSSLNTLNLFEMAHTIKRNYDEMYRDQTLFSFVDNHDVERLATKLEDKDKLPLAYGMLLTLPGIPCIYYGSEWGIEGKKIQGTDAPLRPQIDQPLPNELTDIIKKLIQVRNNNPVIQYGKFNQLILQNQYMAYSRELDDSKVIICLNISDQIVSFNFNEEGIDLVENTFVNLNNIQLDPKTIKIYKVK